MRRGLLYLNFTRYMQLEVIKISQCILEHFTLVEQLRFTFLKTVTDKSTFLISLYFSAQKIMVLRFYVSNVE